MEKGKSIILVLAVLVMFTTTAMVATATEPPTPFHVYGWVFNTTDQPLLNPNVTVKNLNTSEEYTVETNASYSYYQVITSSCNVSASDVLNFSASDDGNSTNRTVTVTPKNMTDGGLFEQNLTISSGEQPDLVISDVWVNWTEGVGCDCTICYNITNIGVGPAGANHNTTLYVDGNEKAYDIVTVTLAANESAIRCFKNYTWQYTHDDNGDGIADGDNITVCADKDNIISEDNEDNNCLIEDYRQGWMCGDVTGDGYVFEGDAFLVFDVAWSVPGRVIQTSNWAADVTGDGYIFEGDGFLICDDAWSVPGREVNCYCKA